MPRSLSPPSPAWARRQQQELEELPLNGRNFSQLGLLQPGVVPLTPGVSEAGGGLRSGQAYAVNGQRPESNNFLIDGANNFNGVDGGFVLKPPVDAISEFRIIRIARMPSSAARWDRPPTSSLGRARTGFTGHYGSSCATTQSMPTTISPSRRSR